MSNVHRRRSWDQSQRTTGPGQTVIDAASEAGCDAVKFQKRTPELCVPPNQRGRMRETPWGYITYLEYRRHMELRLEAFQEIDRYCREKAIV